MFAIYLLNQERIEESIKVFKKIDESKVESKIQYDYIKAYINFMVGYPDFKEAKEICSNVLNLSSSLLEKLIH